MYRVDHTSDVKRGGVYIYYKTMLPVWVLSTNFLQECINFEVSIGNKICKFIHLYKTPSQPQDEFHNFLVNWETNQDDSFNSNTFLTTVIGDLMLNQANGQRMADGPSKGGKLIF